MLKIADEIAPLSMITVAHKNERSTRTLDAVRQLAPKIRCGIRRNRAGTASAAPSRGANATSGRVPNGYAPRLGRT